MFHVKHSDFVFLCSVANFLIVAVEQGSGGGESVIFILKIKKRQRRNVVAITIDMIFSEVLHEFLNHNEFLDSLLQLNFLQSPLSQHFLELLLQNLCQQDNQYCYLS